MQSDLYKNLDAGGYRWLRFYIDSKKTNAFINMRVKITETRTWKKKGGINIDLNKCWLCRKCVERVMHLTPECQMHANNKYLKRHNNASKVPVITWAVKKKISGKRPVLVQAEM